MTSRWTSSAILTATLLALVGCGGGGSLVGLEDSTATVAFDVPPSMDAGVGRDAGEDGPGDLATESPDMPDRPPVRECIDPDNDGFGIGPDCRGFDCRENDPSITDECNRCPPDNPSTGCACRDGTPPMPCDVRTDRSGGPDGVCHLGQRNCVDGRWGSCQVWRPEFRFVGPVSECPGSCLPGCHHQVICPEAGDAIPAGSSNVTVGSGSHAVFCPAGPSSRGGITSTCTTTMGSAYTRGTSPLTWRDACTAPGAIRVLAGSDDGTYDAALPFTFYFYNAPNTTAGIASNGIVTLGAPSTYVWTNEPLPYASAPNSIFAFWDDLYQRSGVCVATFGAAPNRQYVVQWDDNFYYPPGDPTAENAHLNLEVVLTETTNTIDVLYGSPFSGQGDRATGESATIGIQQGTGSSFDQVSYNTAGFVSPGRSIRWTPSTGRTTCEQGVYARTYEASCSNTR